MAMSRVHAYIGLGSNLDHPKQQIKDALLELEALPNTQLVATSSLYCSKPMGDLEQPDYINAVAKIATSLSPERLLDELQKIENQHQRSREGERWEPRTLDLDIILYADQKIVTQRLEIPHYGMADREFVLIPLQEIEEDPIIPGQEPLARLIENLPPHELKKLEP